MKYIICGNTETSEFLAWSVNNHVCMERSVFHTVSIISDDLSDK